MFSKKLLAAAPVAAAAVLAVMVPSGSAFAINSVSCGPAEYLKVYGHPKYGPLESVHRCYANAGKVNFESDFWVDKISTGNNSIRYQDVNGDIVTLKKHTVISDGKSRHIKTLRIL